MIYTIIGAIIIILALILLAILLVPFYISFYIQKRETIVRGYFKVSWLKIRLIQRNIPSEKKEKKEEKKKKKKERKKREFDINQTLKVINQFWNALEYLKPILHAFFKSITLEKLSLDLNIGFYSPVDTAMISGYFWSISSFLNLIPQISLYLTPDFQKSKQDGSLDLRIKIKIYPLAVELLRAITKKPVRELFGSLRKLNQGKDVS